MTDLENAVRHLPGHALCLCKGTVLRTEDGRGISPMMRLLAEGCDLTGFSAADLIVGKAAAMLFVRAGIVAVSGETMSASAKEYLEARGIPCRYGTLTERIINRQGTGLCPMEQTVLALDDPDEAYAALKARLASLRQSGG